MDQGHDTSRGTRNPASGDAEGEAEGQFAEVIDLCTLPSGARPMPFGELDVEEVPHVRALDCSSYNHCLSFVAHVRWRGFSCRRCPLRTGDGARSTSDEDIEAIAAIIRLR